MLTQTKMQLWYPKQVVDARAGPGMKSMTKFKSKNKKIDITEKKKKHFDREYSPVLSDKSDANEDVEFAEVDFLSEDGPSSLSSRTGSPGGSDCEETLLEKSRRHKGQAKRRENAPPLSDFVDADYWKRESVCCGTIFRGLHNEIMVDYRFLKPCLNRLSKHKITEMKSEDAVEVSASKLYSDSSSDSGYDESSNQGTSHDSAFKKEQVSIDEINSQIPKIN